PDPTLLPFLRHAGSDVSSCRTANGATVPADIDTLLPLGLDPRLLPIPPCDVAVTPERRAMVRATVLAFNAEIDAAVADLDRRGTPVASVDLFGLFDRLAATGLDLDGDGSPDAATCGDCYAKPATAAKERRGVGGASPAPSAPFLRSSPTTLAPPITSCSAGWRRGTCGRRM